jgi:hypothetical protein
MNQCMAPGLACPRGEIEAEIGRLEGDAAGYRELKLQAAAVGADQLAELFGRMERINAASARFYRSQLAAERGAA